MNYQKIYDDICKRGQERILPEEVYTEKHHIIPRCMNGDNSKENLTVLTAKEHFLVHYILAEKLYPKNSKLWYAFVRMCNSINKFQDRYIPNSKLYEYSKLKLSELYKNGQCPSKGRKLSEDHKEIIRKANLGKIIGNNQKEILRNLYKNKTYEERFGLDKAKEIKQKLSNSIDHRGEKNPNFGKVTPTEIRQKISNSLKGNCPSYETREKIRQKAIGRKHSEETKQKCREIQLKLGESTNLKKSENCAKNKICKIDGIIYRSAAYAGKILEIKKGIVLYRINSKSDKWKNWKFIDQEL